MYIKYKGALAQEFVRRVQKERVFSNSSRKYYRPRTEREELITQRIDLVHYYGISDRDKNELLDYLNESFRDRNLLSKILWKVRKQLEQIRRAGLLEKDAKNLRSLVIKKLGLFWDFFDNALEEDTHRKYVADYGEAVAELSNKQIRGLVGYERTRN